MKNNRLAYLKNMLLPCVFFSLVTGIATGGLIFLFQAAASAVIRFSGKAYAFAQGNPTFLPLLFLVVAVIGFAASLILRKVPDCRGGGIPTAIAELRGLVPFRWLSGIVSVFLSAMLTYLCGVPLGNEGPSVQMGTAVGRGTVRLFARNNLAWDRYVMTGGAGAGFAAATGAPLTALLFIFEEVHRRFAPMLFIVTAATVLSSAVTTQVLSNAFGMSWRMFDFSTDAVLPLKDLWSALIVGLVCGFGAVLFTKAYRSFRKKHKSISKKIPFSLQIVVVFVLSAFVGFFISDSRGSGHDLIHGLLEGNGAPWYLLICILILRSGILICANNVGVTGGLFVPSLAFGSILGFLTARGLVALGLLGEEYSAILTVIGMAAFLGASSRMPLTGIAFAVEALCGLPNLLPVAFGVVLAYLVIEVVGIKGFNETVVESKVERANAGKTLQTVETDLIVQPGAFAVGKEVRNVLWPPSCFILSISCGSETSKRHSGGMNEGDVLHVHYTTYDNAETVKNLEALVGVQPK